MRIFDRIFVRLGYQRIAPVRPVEVEKAEKESYAQNPLAAAFQQMAQFQTPLKRPATQITMQTLRRMSRTNWVDRTCITTLRDEITSLPWNIVPVDMKKPYNEKLQLYFTRLLRKPNRNNENWRTLIDKVVEDILVVDAGPIEKVRDEDGFIVELYHVDGASLRPCFDEHGIVGSPAYLQYPIATPAGSLNNNKPIAEFENDDLIFMQWNPQGAMDLYPYGMSPVEAGLAVGTAFLYAEAYNLGFFRNNSIPPVIINMGKDVPPGEVDKFRAFLAAEMMGEGGWHSPIVMAGGEGFDIKEVLKHPGDMAWKDYVEWQMRWKVALYRMAPQDIGFALDQYKVEGQVQQILSKNKAISSLRGVIKEYINTEIIGDDCWQDGAENLQFDWVDTEPVDLLKQAQADEIYVRSSVLLPDEVRQERFGKDPIPQEEKLPADEPGTPKEEEKPEEGKPAEEKDEEKKSVKKSFHPEESGIVSLAGNQTAVCWMDDRGCTQPFFVTDYGKAKGFTVKALFLDEKKEQEPPEEEVADRLRGMGVNTPEVRLLTYDEVLRLLPEHLYPDFTSWVKVEPPYASKAWLDRWEGRDRKSERYIVSGFLTGTDLGNEGLQKEMRANPETYREALKDLAKVWVAERKLYLGDRKPGHYLITSSGAGFGVDYQFYLDKASWEKSHLYLPLTLEAIHPDLRRWFYEYALEEIRGSELAKAFRAPKPDSWEAITETTEIEKRLSLIVQKKVYTWYKKAVRTKGTKETLQKAQDFDPDRLYFTDGEYVWQGGVKYPASVLEAGKRPSAVDLTLSPSDYREAFDQGVLQAQVYIKPNLPEGIKLRNPELYAPMFERRVNLIADTANQSLRQTLNDTITRGIDEGKTYGEIAEEIRTALGVDPDKPSMPGWRAERIARTESQWAINEGMREQYKEVGLKKMNISPALSACDECVDAAAKNPYDVGEEGILPIHPSCKCQWVADWTELLKAMPNVQNNPAGVGFVDEAQQWRGTVGTIAFASFGELIPMEIRDKISFVFNGLAMLAAEKRELEQEGLRIVSATEDLKFATSRATQLQQENPKAAYCVVIEPTEFDTVRYLIYEYKP